MSYLDGTVDEITARRALAGADADMLEAGLTPVQADAMTVALRYYLLNEHDEARRVLDVVSGYCVAAGVAFKHLRSAEILLLLNGKQAARA